MKEVYLYTDGSCLGNPGPGGYAAILTYKDKQKEISQGYHLTTNNRMELMAVISGLEALKEPCHVHIITDSQYVKNGVTKWLANWKIKNFRGSNGSSIKNVDLWKRLDVLVQKHQNSWQWVKGHAGHSFNERCDQLAVEAAKSGDKLEDSGFSQS